ncbi:MAG: hypothetical protein AB8B53_07245 [Flavobacteriales bacterium]
MKYFFSAALFSLSFYASAQGVLDGFIDAPKSKSLALSFSGETADTYFLGTGDLDFGFNATTFSVYYKHQFNKWLGVAANLPVVNLTPQDGSVYLKTGKQFKLGNDWIVNGVLGAGGTHPLSDYNTESGTAVGQQTRAIHFRALTQITYRNRWFINGRIGQNLVQDPTPSSLVYSLKLGYYKNKWYTDVWLEEQAADGGKDYLGVGELAADNFRQLGVSYQRIGGVIYHQTKEKLGLFLGFGHTLNGRNAFKTSRISGGLVLKL